jgi:hypothetical protein
MLRSLRRLKCYPKEWRRDPIGAVLSCRILTRSVWRAVATPFYDIRPRLAWRGPSDPAPRRWKRGFFVRSFRLARGPIHPTPTPGFRSGAGRAPFVPGTVDTRLRMPDRCTRPMEFPYRIRSGSRALVQSPPFEWKFRSGVSPYPTN